MAENSIVRVVSSGPGYTVVEDSTGAVVKRTGAKNWRNNNPGNIVAGDFATRYGAVGKDSSGGKDSQGTTVPTMAVFPTLAAGQAAKKALLFGSGSKYAPLSIWDAIERYAGDPKNHTIDISGYAKSVAKAAGVPTSAKWSSLSSSQQDAVLGAISKYEGFKVGTITVEDPAKYANAGNAAPAGAGTTAGGIVSGEAPTGVRPRPNEQNETSKTSEPPSESVVAPSTNALPIMNPLHSYASYTYGLSLALMTVDEYNDVVKNQNYTPKRVVIASAGRYNNTKDPSDPSAFIRAPFFGEDFYFDNLAMETVIGMNAQSRATNAINIDFTIIEPYGMTLIDRIIKLCSSKDVMARNYVEQPYMLQIDFFGIDDTGMIVGSIPNQTKRIPIRIMTMDITASEKGAEYKIKCCPYNHSAYDVSTLSTPAHFEIVAGTVAGFFQSNEAESALTTQLNQREKVANSNLQRNSSGQVVNQNGDIVPLTAIGNGSSEAVELVSADPKYKVKSYGSAYNAFQADLKKTNKISVADKIFFKFSPELQNAKFVLDKNLASKDTPMAEASASITMRENKTDAVSASLSYKTQVFSINSGTTIEMVINYAIRNSDYIQNQLTVAEDYGADVNAYLEKKKSTKDQPLNWFKIVPQVVLTEYDKIRKVWGREITYNVVPYKIYNVKIAAAPQGTWKYPVKDYNYYYTGKNLDVLGFDIQFNALYYTAVTAYKNHMSATYGLSQYDDQELNPDKYEGIPDPANAIQPSKEKPITLDASNRATGSNYTPKSATAADTQGTIYTTAGGDMIQGTLKIIGDPHFIKQDDIFYPPYNVVNTSTGSVATAPKTSDSRLIADGSLQMDQGEVYVQITFKIPSDIDETTGLMNYSSEFQTNSMFSGMYKVLTVSSTFNSGKFEQTLTVIRLPRQTSLDYVADNQTTARTENSQPSAVKDIKVAPEATKSIETKPVTDDKAPGNNPVTVSEDPTPANKPSAEQAKLAEVKDSAPEKSITQATADSATKAMPEAPPATVPPQASSPSPEKLALKAKSDSLEAEKNAANKAANDKYDQIAEIQSRIEGNQANIERANLNLSRGKITQAEADQLIADYKERISALQSQLSTAEAEYKTLNAANRDAQAAFVTAKRAYIVAE